MRVLRGSQTHGLAGMSAVTETATVRLLRPLLETDPAQLREFLTASSVDWVEDPSNHDLHALRPRLRPQLRQSLAATPMQRTALRHALSAVARLRAREEAQTAAELAVRVTIWPEGFALLSPGRISPAALRCLIQTIAGAPYPPSPAQVSDLAARPGPATLAGVRVIAAGRYGDGLLIVREEAAVADPVPATNGTIWDNRFRLVAENGLPSGTIIGKLGADAPCFRRSSDLPSAVLRTLPAIRIGKVLAAVPQIGYGSPDHDVQVATLFSPRRPAGGPCFTPTLQVT